MKVTIVVAYNKQVEMTKKFLDTMEKTLLGTVHTISLVLVHGYVADEEDIVHPAVTKFVRVKNIGYCNTINAGLKEVDADTDYVFLTGNDSFPREAGWLDKLVTDAEITKSAIVAPADHLPMSSRFQLIDKTKDRYAYCHMWPSIAWLIPKKVLDEIGLMDERFYGAGYYADDDYCRRVIDKYGPDSIIVVTDIILDHLTSKEGVALGITGQMGDLHIIYQEKWRPK